MRTINRPQVSYEEAADLPILGARDEIINALGNHQVLVICGETGSGKSTQLPKFCLEAGFGQSGMIGHTQPRRLAARSIANRLAEELNTPLGTAVGYQVRFHDRTGPACCIKLMTDGILLAETQTDRWLRAYDALIIDEAHERSLNIDFLLGIVARILPRRPDLRLMITSATIDAARFAAHFSVDERTVPVIHVAGRSYPVEVQYRPLADDEDQQDYVAGIANAIRELSCRESGDVLVFLPTERDILDTHKRLRGMQLTAADGDSMEILPLYARLSTAEQNRIYQPTKRRRIVLATNVAESSLTIPGIRYVIDLGTARISRYAARSKVQRLPIEPISRASADQRKGRCGRIAPGMCIRLYSQADYEQRPEFTTPEIQRTNLASVILRAKVLKLGELEEFPFIDPPRPEAIADGYGTLFEIGAVDDCRELTSVGRQLAKFPVDPRIARIICAAEQIGCLAEMLIIAAALEVQDPRERPLQKQQQADEAHARFADEDSDFMGLLRLWDFYHQLKRQLSRGQLHKACQQNFLSPVRMREWTEIHLQLLQLVHAGRMKCDARRDDPTEIHQALLTGFLSGVAYRSGDFEYTGAGGIKFYLWPGSALFQQRPKWCLIGELVETRRRYGRLVARIQPNWIEPLALHLIKRQFDQPHWHRTSGRVMVWENVTLFGLPIVRNRRVPYAAVNAAEAHEIFLRDALGRHDLDCSEAFLEHNRKIVEQAQQLAARSRDSRYFVDEYTLHRFYFERIPSEVHDVAGLRAWLRRNPQQRDQLKLDLTNVADDATSSGRQESLDAYPDELRIGDLCVPVFYQFSPGSSGDGVTIQVPQAGLSQLTTAQLSWGIRGHLLEKVVTLLRSLPKSVRRALIPIPDTARDVVAELRFGEGDLGEQLASIVSRLAEEKVTPAMFDWDKVPQHLMLNVQVLDAQGEVIAEGRQLRDVSQHCAAPQAPTHANASAGATWNRTGVVTWDFEELPDRVSVMRAGIEVHAFPALRDRGESVDVFLATHAAVAERETHAGVRRLFALQNRKGLRSQLKWLPQFNNCCLWAHGLMPADELQRQVADLLACRAVFQPGETIPRTRAAFEARLANAVERIGLATQDVAKWLPSLWKAYHEVRLALDTLKAPGIQDSVHDMRQQLTNLMSSNFLVETPWEWLVHFPRYLRGIAHRIEHGKLASAAKDRQLMEELSGFWQRYQERRAALESLGQFDPELETYRWMLEEYRVSCFAQALGTSVRISAVRLEKQWQRTQTV